MKKNKKKTWLIVAVLLILSYVTIQGHYVFKETPMSGNAIFTQWSYERTVDWPIGDTLIRRVGPTSEEWRNDFPSYVEITVDRFFYKKIKVERYGADLNGLFF